MIKKILSTHELETYITSKLKKSKYVSEFVTSLHKNYIFTDKLLLPGTYVFSSKNNYHIIAIGDRGNKYPAEIFYNLEELSSCIYWELASDISLHLHYDGEGDRRRYVFANILELLSSLDSIYLNYGKKTINAILEFNPFVD